MLKTQRSKEISSGVSNTTESSTAADSSGFVVGSSVSSFESLLLRIREQLGYEFPNAAVVELPLIISKETQEALLSTERERGLEAAEKAILTAIDKINRGSLETVDKLIRDNLFSTQQVKVAEVEAEAESNRADAGA